MATNRTSTVDLALQPSALGFDRPQRGADPAELGGAPGLLDQRRMPCPFTTNVPENTHGVASPPGGPMRAASAPGVARVLRTGTDSPVSADSSTERFTQSTITASAGTRSPSASRTTSPRTTSRPAMRT